MGLPVFFAHNRPYCVHCVNDNDAEGIIFKSMFIWEGFKSIFPAFRGLGPYEVDKGEGSRKHERVLKHCVGKSPAVIQLQYGLEWCWQR